MAIDLENFPTRETAKYMLSMVSPIYENSYVGKWLFEVMSYFLEIARQTVIEDLPKEAFPETATWTLPYWEQAYGIPINESLTVEQRRAKIVRRRNYRKPMNPARMASLVQEVSGCEAEIVENTAPHTFDVQVYAGDGTVDYDTIRKTIYNAKQSQKHARICMTTQIGITIHAEQQSRLYPFILCGSRPDYSWATSLGGGGLAAEIKSIAAETNYRVCGAPRLP